MFCDGDPGGEVAGDDGVEEDEDAERQPEEEGDDAEVEHLNQETNQNTKQI